MRYPVSIMAAHPRTGTIHWLGVEFDFGQAVDRRQIPAGTPVPPEAVGRTICRRDPADGFLVIWVGAPNFDYGKMCQLC